MITPSRAAVALGVVLLVTGTLHFVATSAYASIVPGFLGPATFWVRASGVAELGCAVGLLVRRTRRWAGPATAVLFVAVFPANVQMAVDVLTSGDSNVPVTLVVLARLPLQGLLIWWALWSARPARPGPRPPSASDASAG